MMEQHINIKFCVKLKKTYKETLTLTSLRRRYIFHKNVYKRFSRLKYCQILIKNDLRSIFITPKVL